MADDDVPLAAGVMTTGSAAGDRDRAFDASEL
jgi:hypothetical protein